MRAATCTTAAVVALAMAVLTPALAAQEPPATAGLEREMRALNASLGELVELLRRQLEGSHAAMLMQRVELMTRRIAPLEEELQKERAAQRRLQDRLDEAELSARSYEAQLEQAVTQGELDEAEARDQLEQQLPMLALHRKQIDDQMWAVEQRVIDLERRLAARRAEIETWEGEIDRALGLR